MENAVEILTGVFTNPLFFVFLFIFSISFVIFVHELGHYLVARFFGVDIEKFSIGFGREVFGFTNKSGTRWSFAAIPLGGYIKICGDVDPDDPQIWDEKIKDKRPMTANELKGAYCTKSVWQRILIVAAGPAINILLGFVIFLGLYSLYGQPSSKPVITAIGKDTAAYDAGLMPYDEIISMDGEPVNIMRDVFDTTLEETQTPFTFEILRGDRVFVREIASRPVEYQDSIGISRSHGRIGMSHMRSIKYEDIASVNGEYIKGDHDLGRRLIHENLGRLTEVGLKIGTLEDVFLMVPEVEDNAFIFDEMNEDFDKFWIAPKDEVYFHTLSFGDAWSQATIKTTNLFREGFNVLSVMITGQAKKKVMGGMGSIGKAASDAMQDGAYMFLAFIALLSLQIAFINLLPIPVLDGGHLVFYTYEVLAGKPLSRKIQDGALMFGLVFLFGIMVIANVSDLLQLAL